MSVNGAESAAWKWLLGLERLNWQEAGHGRVDNQIIIRACPGNLGTTSGAPLVRLSVEFPHTAEKKRFKASGNSLAAAAAHLHGELVRQGVEVARPPIEVLFSA